MILGKFMFLNFHVNFYICEAIIVIVRIKVRLTVVGLTWLPEVFDKWFLRCSGRIHALSEYIL